MCKIIYVFVWFLLALFFVNCFFTQYDFSDFLNLRITKYVIGLQPRIRTSKNVICNTWMNNANIHQLYMNQKCTHAWMIHAPSFWVPPLFSKRRHFVSSLHDGWQRHLFTVQVPFENVGIIVRERLPIDLIANES